MDTNTATPSGNGHATPAAPQQPTPAPAQTAPQSPTPYVAASQSPGASVAPIQSEPEAPANAYRAALARYGIDAGSRSDDEIANALVQRAIEGRKAAEEAEQLRAFYYQQRYAQQQPAPQAAATPEPKPEPEFPFEWESPEYNPEWEQYCQKNPSTGRWEATNWMGVGAVEKLNHYETTVRKQQEKLYREFPKLVKQITEQVVGRKEKELQEYAITAASAAILDQQEKQFRMAEVQKRISLYSVKDQNGQPVRNQDGSFVFGPQGQAYASFLNEAKDRELPINQWLDFADRSLAWAVQNGHVPSMQQAPPAAAAPQQTPPAAQPETPQQFGDQNFLNFAAGQLAAQPRTGSFPMSSTAPPQNPHESADEMMIRLCRERGILPQ